METKKRFKMYKSGKLWVSAAIVSLSVMAGVAVNGQTAKADENKSAQTQLVDQSTTTSSTTGNKTTDDKGNATGAQTDTNTSSQTSNDSKGNADDQNKNQSQSETTNVNATRTIKFTNDNNQPISINGKTSDAQQSGNVQKVTTTTNGKTTVAYKTDGVTFPEYKIPQIDGAMSYVDNKPATTLSADKVTLDKDGNLVNPEVTVVYKFQTLTPTDAKTDTKNPDMYKTVTRTIEIHDQNGKVTSTITKSVNLGRTKTPNGNGKYTYGDWKNLAKNSQDIWDKYTIPTIDGYVSKVAIDGGDAKFATVVPEVDKFDGDPKDSKVIVTYQQAKNEDKAEDHKDDPNYWKAVTRTINFKLAVGSQKPVVQTVTFKRNKITMVDANGKENEEYTNWEADGHTAWNDYNIPQINFYHTEVNGTRSMQIASQNVTPDMQDQTLTVTYVSDGTDPNNQNVVPGLNGNWANIDAIYMTDAGIHVTGWNANSQSFNHNYHYLIVLDYGQNPTPGHFTEVGRILIQDPVYRPDVFKVHPVWNAAYSGFDETIPLNTNAMHQGDKLRILSRWTSDLTGNTDYTDLIGPYYTMDYNTNLANLDSFKVNGNQLEATGWHASNNIVGRPYHYVILYDATTNREITRQRVQDGIDRPDVANVYKNILAASKSGFDVKFDLTNVNLGHNLQIISRYSDGANGEGHNLDYWFPPKRLVSGDLGNYGNLDNVSINNGKIHFTGWNATNYSQLEPNRFMILYDVTDNKQVAFTKLSANVQRSDVNKAYLSIQGSGQSGYDVTFDANDLTYGHTYALVSRYSTDSNDNGNNGAHVDHWFNNALLFNQQGYSIDSLTLENKPVKKDSDKTKAAPRADVAKSDADAKKDSDTTKGNDSKDPQAPTTINQLTVSGWMASDASGQYPNAYVILLDANGKEVTRQKVTLTGRPDVQKAFPAILNSDNSGFAATFNLSDDQLKQLQKDGIQLVLRYSSDANHGEGNRVDQWTHKYAFKNNKFVQL